MTPARVMSAVLLAVVMLMTPLKASLAGFIETPMLIDAVKAGKLPPVEQRLPRTPRVIDLESMGRESGRHGGQLRMLMGDPKDIRMMTVYSYARLVTYDAKLALQPDILESYMEAGERIFTLKLRPGHRWSDGHPFTAEDFRYFWEDVAKNDKLSLAGPPIEMLVDGKPPVFEIIDETTVRYTWHAPNPAFLPALAGARPLYIFMPSHYLRRFHIKHSKGEALDAAIKAEKVRSWSALHERKSRMYRPENPELPCLEAWCNSSSPPATRFSFKRNPFFHRVDSRGRQLPYIDEVMMTIGSSSLVPAQAGSGEADLQARYIRFDNYTFLKQAESRDKLKVRLWERGEGSRVALYPNLNANDPVWRALWRDVRVRRALSLAVDRREINKAIFYGLARESQNTVLPASPLYRSDYADAWAKFDLKQANRLLDEAGLARRDSDGVRFLPDGRRAEIIVETSGWSTEEADVLSLIHDTWLKAGLKIYIRPTQLDLFRKRVYSGETIMSVWTGYDNGVPTSGMSPSELAPTQQPFLQWPKWGLHYEGKGKAGEPVDMPEAKQLLKLLSDWHASPDDVAREKVWHAILGLHADQVFSIGTVNGTLQPVVTSKTLVNVPEKAIFNFDPGGFFGRYLPDTFWFRELTN